MIQNLILDEKQSGCHSEDVKQVIVNIKQIIVGLSLITFTSVLIPNHVTLQTYSYRTTLLLPYCSTVCILSYAYLFVV